MQKRLIVDEFEVKYRSGVLRACLKGRLQSQSDFTICQYFVDRETKNECPHVTDAIKTL